MKYTKMATNITKWPQDRPNGHKKYQRLPLKDPTKFTQIGFFGFENIPSGNPDFQVAVATSAFFYILNIDRFLHHRNYKYHW
jgi:hypothetical protein